MSNKTFEVSIRWSDLTPEKQHAIETEYIQSRIGAPDEMDSDGEDGVLGTITIGTI